VFEWQFYDKVINGFKWKRFELPLLEFAHQVSHGVFALIGFGLGAVKDRDDSMEL